MGGIQGHVVVVEAAERGLVVGAILDNDLLGHHGQGGGHAHACAEDEVAVGAHLGDFDDGHVDVAVEAVAHVLAQVAQVRVEVVHMARVGELARIRVALVGRTQVDGVDAAQLAVHVVVRRRAGEEVDLELFAFLMEFLGHLGQGNRYNFRRAGGGEARKAHIVPVFDDAGRLFCRDERYAHFVTLDFNGNFAQN